MKSFAHLAPARFASIIAAAMFGCWNDGIALAQGQVSIQSPVARNVAYDEPLVDEPLVDERLMKLFGKVDQLGDLPPYRRSLANSPAADAVFSAEAVGRRTSDVGHLIERSKAAHGVSVQRRTPIVSDTRVRGQRVGQILASGSYWAPARQDLDTMMSKIDSRLIENLVLVKGPYATRYGPGFRFVDLEFIQSPRHAGGFQVHGSTSATYQTNGAQWYGRQSIHGGSDDYGFFVSYGHSTGNDYETGQSGFFMPTSYKSRDLFAAVGVDLSSTQWLELNVLRLDQTDIEFPGLVFDLNFLVTDGYEVTYRDEAPGFSDGFVAEVWYNRTRFEGDTLRAGKNRQIPTLALTLDSFSGRDGYAITDGDALSAGYRLESRYDLTEGYFSIGTDLIFLNQELNDIEPEGPIGDNNFPIPRSHSVDVGMYVEDVEQVTSRLKMTAGARVDGVFTDSEDVVDGVAIPLSVYGDAERQQEFLLGAAYLTGEYSLGGGWLVNAGFGTAHRPPTLTELYAASSFIGTLQRGLTYLDGDAELESEKIIQFDLGTQYGDSKTQCGAHVFCSWIHDYITFDLYNPVASIVGFQQGVSYVNTDLATMSGMECYGQHETKDWLTVFGALSFTEGRDLSRNKPSRNGPLPNRSGTAGVDHEPLPGINPLEARLGAVVHDPSPSRRWAVEFLARVVDNQDRFAQTLEEVETSGFTTYDIRCYRRMGDYLLTAGVENLSNKFYREHIDYWTAPRGLFRPGVGFYCGAQLEY